MNISKRILHRVVLIFSLVCGNTLAAYADKGAVDQLHTMISANSLDGIGRAPFHVKIAFKYYDLDGKLADTGTVEEWWVSAQQYRTVIASPTLNDIYPAEAGTTAAPSRESYLVQEMLNAEVHPFPHYSTLVGLDVRGAKHNVDGNSLNCVLVEMSDQERPSLTTPTFCADPTTNALRMRSNLGASTITRNSIGSFHDVNVAMDLQIAYGYRSHDQIAIAGHVTGMQTFDPTKTVVELGAPPQDRFEQNAIPEAFIRGKNIDKRRPRFPPFAAATLDNGTVTLRGVIQKDGTVKGLVVMSSFNKELSASAVEAVQDWKYKPYLVDESPVEVVSNFYINFINSGTNHVPRKPY